MTKKDNDKTPKKYKLRKNDKKKNYKVTENSDSDEDDSDWAPGDDDVMDEYENALEFQKFLQQLFPSKNQSEKVRQLKNIKKMLNRNDEECIENDDEEEEEEEQKQKTRKKKSKKKVVKKKQKKKKKKEEDDEEHEEEDEEEDDDEEVEDEELTYINEDGEEVEMDPQNMKFNIVFTMGDKNNGI